MKARPSPCPTRAMTVPTARKMSGRTTQAGRPVAPGLPPKYRSSTPESGMRVADTSTTPTRAARPIGAQTNMSVRDLARRNPIPRPRKVPRRMKFVKYER